MRLVLHPFGLDLIKRYAKCPDETKSAAFEAK